MQQQTIQVSQSGQKQEPVVRKRKYDYDVLSVSRDKYVSLSGEEKSRLTKIGVAFRNEKGSITVLADALPCSLLLIEPREEVEGKQ